MTLENMKNMARGNPVPMLVVLALSSLIVGAASVERCNDFSCGGFRALWGITVGFLSFLLNALMVALCVIRVDMADRVHFAYAPLMFVVWVISAAILTSSSGLFPITGNGYFGTWICVFISLYYWSIHFAAVNKVGHVPSLHGLTLIVIFSCIEWATAAEGCGTRHNCSGKWGFAIFVGVFTTIVAGAQMGLYFFMRDMAEKFALWVGLVLWVTWVFGCGFLTSETGIFPYTGNGYLSSWACFFASLYYTLIHSPFGERTVGEVYDGDRSGAASPGFEHADEFESRMSMPGPHDM